MLSILAIIVNSLSKQFYRSFSNINPGSIVGGRQLLERRKDAFKEICGKRGKIFDMSLSLWDTAKRKGL